MKILVQIIIVLVLLVMSTQTIKAQVRPADSTFVDKELEDINDAVVSEQVIRDLCRTARKEYLHRTTEFNLFKDTLEFKIGISKDDPQYKDKMTQFWKDNMDRFICPEYTSNGRIYPKQHIFKRLMHEKYPDFYYDYLFAEDLVEVDFNFVEQTVRGPETIVDYLDFLLIDTKDDVTYDAYDLKDIRDGLLEEFGAKRAKDLGY